MASTEFGQTVRRWRDRVAPRSGRTAAGGHRRAAGLRREELALLAGISVDYVTRLEQGRAANPSGRLSRRWPGRCDCRRTSAASVPARGARAAGPWHRARATSRRASSGCWTGWSTRPSRSPTRPWTLLLANPLYAALMGDRPAGAAWNATARGATSSGSCRPAYATRRRNAAPGDRAWSPSCATTATRYPADRATAAPDRGTARRQRAVRRAVGLGRCGTARGLAQDHRAPAGGRC